MDATPVCYLRHPETAIVGHRSQIILIRSDGTVGLLRENIDIFCKLLVLLRQPAGVKDAATNVNLSAESVEELLGALIAEQAIISLPTRSVQPKASSRIPSTKGPVCKRLIFGISGAIQAASILGHILALRGSFAQDVEVIITEAATKFIRPEVLTYYGFSVWTDAYETRREVRVPHMHLASSADLVAIIPASAHTIHRLATGACSDLLSLTVAATKAPIMIAPAMNSQMLAYPSIRRNIDLLRADGMYVIEPGLGIEASDATGEALQFCGIGVKEANIGQVLEVVLAIARNGGLDKSN